MKTCGYLHKIGLAIPLSYVVELSKKDSNNVGQKNFVLAVHNTWIRQVISEKKIPQKFLTHETLTDDQINAFLRQGALDNFGPGWHFLHLTVLITASDQIKTYKKLNATRKFSSSGYEDLNVVQQRKLRKLPSPQILEFIGEANFNYTWEHPVISFLEDSEPAQNELSTHEQIHSTEETYLHSFLDIFYEKTTDEDLTLPKTNQTSTSLAVGSNSQNNSIFSISNLAHPLSVLKIQKNTFLIFHTYSHFTLQDCVNFSPDKLLSSNVKLLFVLYQILQFLYDLETYDIPVSNITLPSIWTDECLFINIKPNIEMILKKLEIEQKDEFSLRRIDERVQKFLTFSINKVKNGSLEENSEERFDAGIVESVIRHWCQGLITNFEYLMFLNFLCGRVCNINPNYHPVFPWVSDFSVRNGGWRDLSKSKFRLNKGEKQLTLMFEEKGSVNSIPHHITDILSEITYYVYKARQTPKELLCKFVRPKWVPAEYPVSVQRIYDWSPDECVPEFFYDAAIFKSIHPDLPDLLPPSWCSSAEDFIRMHNDLLESDHVSSKLHHWIDHTFGYKLVGSAAVRSKNVYLSLVDKHEHLMKNGIVQLFQTPHPPRRNRLRDYKNIVSYSELTKIRENDSEKEADFITLPRHYDPMGFLNDFEVSLNFFKTHFNSKSGVELKGIKPRGGSQSEYIKLFGCLLIELTFPTKVQHVVNAVQDIDQRFQFYQTLMDTLEPIPIFVRRTIQVIFSPNTSLDFSIPLDISTRLLLMAGDLSPIPFPKYFEQLYKLVKGLRVYDSSLSVADPFDTTFLQKIDEVKVKAFSRDLIQMINDLDEDGLELILPFVLELFKNPGTRVLTVWNLFCPFARAIGRERAVQTLLGPIVQIYESDYNSDKHLKLFHRSFLLQLQSCFGLRSFLENFATLIIEPIGGWKHLENGITNSRPTHLKNCFEEVETTPETTRNPPTKLLNQPSYCADQDCDSASSHEIEPDIFVMEPDVSDSEESVGSSRTSVVTCEVSTIVDETKETSVLQSSPHSRGSISSYNDSKGNKLSIENDITEMCCESIIWLVHRLGPVLCAKYVSKNLLRMLTLCYLGHLDTDNPNRQSNCDGNCHAERVHECLLAINDLYGNCFIECQYIPYCIEVLNSSKNRMSTTLEAALVGISSLLERVVNYIDDSVLVGLLNNTLLSGLLRPITNLATSSEAHFPSGSGPRIVLIEKLLNMVSTIRNKIGPDFSQQLLKPLVIQICDRYQNIPPELEENSKVKQNLHLVFNKSLAHRIFTNFYEMVVGCESEIIIQDLFLLHGQGQITIKESSPSWEKGGFRKKIESQSSFGSRSFGNKISIQEHDSTSASHEQDTNSTSSSSSSKDTTRHIKGNWLVYWEHEIGRSDSKFYFKQIKLQSYSGHTSSIRSIWSLNNENSFLTGSKDRTCKVFSLRNQGDESVVVSHKWTYTHHKKAVLSVLFNEQLHLAASTDGRIHIWDPFVGKHIRILDTKSICCLKPIGDSSCIVGAGTEYCVIVDPRTCHSYELKMGIGQNMGMARCMSVTNSGHVLSVGHSSGMLSSLDLRNGNLLGSWKGHEGEILQLISYKDRFLISSSLDQNLLVWNIDDNKLAFQMRGPTEPVISLATLNSDLVTCSTSNRIGVHSGIDPNADFSSIKLRSDTCKGTVTTLNLLPLNQALLVGSDSGLVYLIC